MDNDNKNSKKLSDLPHRTLINGFAAILVAIFIFLGEYPLFRWVFTGLLAFIASIALWEFYQILKKKLLQPAVTLGIVSGIIYIFAIFFEIYFSKESSGIWFNAPEIVLGLAFLGCFIFYAIQGHESILNIASTFFGLIYIIIPLGLIERILYFFIYKGQLDPYLEGSWWLAYLILVTKSSDMGGYFIGRRYGKRKLAVTLSPNKTIAGAVGGTLAGILVSLIWCLIAKILGHVFVPISYWDAIWFGCLMSVVGQCGDLAESLLKRDAKVKDSNAIPGVGGILDMIDSLLFTAPILYIFLKIQYA